MKGSMDIYDQKYQQMHTNAFRLKPLEVRLYGRELAWQSTASQNEFCFRTTYPDPYSHFSSVATATIIHFHQYSINYRLSFICLPGKQVNQLSLSSALKSCFPY